MDLGGGPFPKSSGQTQPDLYQGQCKGPPYVPKRPLFPRALPNIKSWHLTLRAVSDLSLGPRILWTRALFSYLLKFASSPELQKPLYIFCGVNGRYLNCAQLFLHPGSGSFCFSLSFMPCKSVREAHALRKSGLCSPLCAFIFCNVLTLGLYPTHKF
jgi:hypothetical protein